MKQEKVFKKLNLIMILLMVYDFIVVAAAYFTGLWIRFDCIYSEIQPDYLHLYKLSIIPYCIICVVVFSFMRLYSSIWEFASYDELHRSLLANTSTFLAYIIIMNCFVGFMPISYYLFGGVLQFFATTVIRFCYRFVLLLRAKNVKADVHIKKCMIIGAGFSGRIILRDIKISDKNPEEVCCLIDDDPEKQGKYIDGVPIIGGRDSILFAVEKYHIEKIYLAFPSATAEQKRDILNICQETNCEVRSLPAIYQLANGEVTLAQMREVAIEDLLGRDPITVDMGEIFNYLKGKVILVTGGGGSIGSELCRQIAAHNPKQLIIFDVYENNAYDIQLELRKKYPELNLEVLIGSVRDSRKMFQVFETYHPEIVYHAAAHKHVPLMEDSPCEAIKNNVLGTYKTAFAAISHGCEKFVLISTDKAVNPTNVMGASKRICEMVIQAFDSKVKEGKAEEIPQLFTHWMRSAVEDPKVIESLKAAKTEFVAVRFGNVLGSNGSVIPLFKRQISEGGPVTVTHPDIIRYFMTIPEAVSLVLQAGTYAKGGEIFILDMGSPMKIVDLARNLIKLTGHVPDGDIKIEFTGLRPGEKLYEEKLMSEEGLRKTKNKLIHIGQPIPFDIDEFWTQLNELMILSYKNKENIRELVAEVVTTYHSVDRP